MKPLLLPALALGTLSITSCAPLEPPPIPLPAERVMYEWYDDGGPEPFNIEIELSRQIATFKRGNREVGWSYVATGEEGRETRPGTFPITEKIVDKYSNRYGWLEDEFGNVTNSSARYDIIVPPGQKYVPAPMPYWMRLTNYGIGMHAGPIPRPGLPASHGCIRMPKEVVTDVFAAAKVGTPVKIVP